MYMRHVSPFWKRAGFCFNNNSQSSSPNDFLNTFLVVAVVLLKIMKMVNVNADEEETPTSQTAR